MKQDRIVLERLMSHRISEQLAEIDSVYFARLYEAIGGRIYKKSAQSLKRLSSNEYCRLRLLTKYGLMGRNLVYELSKN